RQRRAAMIASIRYQAQPDPEHGGIPSQVRRGSVDAALIFGHHRPRFFRYVQENAYHLRIEASSGKLLNPLSGELERGSALVGALEIGRASCRERVEMSVGVCRLYM